MVKRQVVGVVYISIFGQVHHMSFQFKHALYMHSNDVSTKILAVNQQLYIRISLNKISLPKPHISYIYHLVIYRKTRQLPEEGLHYPPTIETNKKLKKIKNVLTRARHATPCLSLQRLTLYFF